MISKLFIFLIESSVCLVFFYMLFKLVFQKFTFFQWNRFYILSTVVLSIIIPLLDFEMQGSEQLQFVETSILAIDDAESIFLIDEVSKNGQLLSEYHQLFSISNILFGFYILGVFGAFFLLTIRLISVGKLLRKAKISIKKGYRLVEISEIKSPFSFLDYIFMPVDSKITELERQQIIKHELVHISQYHSVDTLFIELVTILLWFNPLLRFYKSALEETHEFIADAVVSNNDTKDYSILLLRLATHKPILLANGFARIPIKNRIIMLNKNKTNNMKKASFFSIIPLSLFLVFMFSFSLKEKVKEKIVQLAPEISVGIIKTDTIPSINPLESIDIVKLASGFGMRIHPNFKTKKMHTGVDFTANLGVPVHATADGIIDMTRSDESGYGLHIKVKHGETYATMYAHLSEIAVREGDQVKKGDIIGLVGNSGYSVGPHLHYEVIKNGKKVNPVDYF